jgi:hypothetical protein
MRPLQEPPPVTPDLLAKLLYESYCKRSKEYDPRFWPLGLYSWEQLPGVSKKLLIQVATDLIRYLNDY